MKKTVVIVGGIASGKTTLCRELEKRGFNRIITYTTRPKRSGEIDGVNYHFTSMDDFVQKYKSDFFMESISYKDSYGHRMYGSAREDYNRKEDTVIVLDPRGVITLNVPAFIVWLDLDRDILINRALSRGDWREDIERRMATDDKFIDLMKKLKPYDLRITRVEPVDVLTNRIIEALNCSRNLQTL